MKSSFAALIWLKVWGAFICAVSIAAVLILAEPQRLSYFSFLLFTHQETLKTIAICGIFLGVFFLFYTSSKIPERYLKLKLFKGPMKLHPEMLKKTLEQWFSDQKLVDLKLLNVLIMDDKTIGIECKTSHLSKALSSLEEIEAKLKVFMNGTLGITDPIDVHLFEI